MACLPDEIMKDILLRLPTKSLVRFRCVCKSWKSLLTCISFIQVHLYRSLQLRSKNLLKYENNDRSVVRVYHPGDFGLSGLSYLVPSSDQVLAKFDLVGSCNGVICLSTFYKDDADKSKIFLWNPSINECVVLPQPCFQISEFLAFGFDPTSGHVDDFKVLNINRCYRFDEIEITEHSSQVEVYSFRTNSWKQLGDVLPSLLHTIVGSNRVIFGSFICWCVYEQLVLFDVAGECFQEMGLPSFIPNLGSKCITLLDGCLSLILRNPLSDCYEVWIMREFGMVNSWTKLYSTRVSAHDGDVQCWPLGFAGSNEIFFAKNYVLDLHYKPPSYVLVYNMGERNFVGFGVEVEYSVSTRLVGYVESLVSLVTPCRITCNES